MLKELIITMIVLFSVILTGCYYDQLPVTDFDSCVSAGNPVMESYPRQCMTDDGRIFREEIDEPTIVDGDEGEEIKDRTVCTEEDKNSNMCTFEYAPVCGDDGKTHANGCVACTSGSVDYYVEGECFENAEESDVFEMDQQLCDGSGGNWNECSSRCQIDNQGQEVVACTLQCEQLCECGGIAGFRCPEGYACKIPDGIMDAMGYCVRDYSLEDVSEGRVAYEIAEVTDESCNTDADCTLPMDYAVRSNCPYESICKDDKCTVVCPDYNNVIVTENPIGGDTDNHGCMVAAGYSYDTELGACVRGWELTNSTREAVKIVTQPLSFDVTVVGVDLMRCPGCFNVHLQRNDNKKTMTVTLIDWEIVEEDIDSVLSNEEFCGLSTYDKCSTDADCRTAGCSGQICQLEKEEQMATTCEYRECYNAQNYGLSCGCVEGMCQWN